MVASGNEVGKISIRVVPNLEDFHDDIKRQLAEEEKKRYEVKVGTDEYEEGVEKANKRASKDSKVAPGFDGSKYTKEYEKANKDLWAKIEELNSQIINLYAEPELSKDAADKLRSDIENVRGLEAQVGLDVEAKRAINAIQDAARGLTLTTDPIEFPTLVDIDRREFEKQVSDATEGVEAEVSLKVNLDRFKRRYKNKFQALIADFEANIPLTADGELIRVSLKGLEDEFDGKLALIDPNKDINTIVRLRRQVERLYRDTRQSAPELLGKNVSQETKQTLKSLSELTKFGADLAAQMVEFDRAVAQSKAKSDRIWSDVDYRLRISVDDGQIVKIRRSLSERVVVPVSLQAKFDKGGFTRSAAIAVAGAKELTSVVASPFKLLASAPGIAAKAFARLGPEVVALTALISALLPPVLALGAGFITLAPSVLAALVPIGAIALGIEGIKKAAETAKPAFEQLQQSISAVFEKGMQPGFEAIRDRLIPGLQIPFEGVATSISNAFNGVISSLTSPSGLNSLQNIFDNVAAGIQNAIPGLQKFTDGILNLVSAISEKFGGLGTKFSDLGGKFADWVTTFTTVPKENGLTGLEQTIENVKIGLEGLQGVFNAFFGQGMKDISSADFGASMKKFFGDVESFVRNTLPVLTQGFQQFVDLLNQAAPLFDLIGGAANLAGLVVNPAETINDAVSRYKETGSLKDLFTGIGPGAEKGGQEAAAGLNKGLETGLEQTKKSIEDSLKPSYGVASGEFGGGIDDDGIGPAITGKVNTAISAAKSTLTAFQGEFAGMIATALQPVNQIPEKLNVAFAGMGAAFVGAFTAIKEIVTSETTQIGDIIAQGFMTIPAKLTTAFAGLGGAVAGAMIALKGVVTSNATGIADAFGQAFSGAAGRVSSALAGVTGAVASALTPALGVVASTVAGILASLQGGLAAVVPVVEGSFAAVPAVVAAKMAEANAAVAAGGQQMVSTALAFAGAMESAGRSIGASFAAGIASSAGLVSAAAQSLVAAARVFFPNSPAKEGPFSGSGWVDKSGEAVGEGFASGMSSSQQEVVATARALMQSVKDIFGSAEGLTLNFNLGGVTEQAEAATKQVQVFGDTLSKVPTGPLKDLAVASGTGSSADSEAQRKELSQQLDLLEMERKALELEKSRAGANNEVIKARLAEIKEQKLQLGLQKDQLDYAKKYGDQVDGSSSKMDDAYKNLTSRKQPATSFCPTSASAAAGRLGRSWTTGWTSAASSSSTSPTSKKH